MCLQEKLFFHGCKDIPLIGLSAAVTYNDCNSQSGRLSSQIKLVLGKAEVILRSKQQLSLNVHSYLDLFLHGSSSSFDNHWRYQQRYHELLGWKSASFIWCIKWISLNGVEWHVEMGWKNFEKDRKSVGTVLEIWQKSTCSEIPVQKYSFFVWCNRLEAVSGRCSSSVGKFFENCLGWSSFYS